MIEIIKKMAVDISITLYVMCRILFQKQYKYPNYYKYNQTKICMLHTKQETIKTF